MTPRVSEKAVQAQGVALLRSLGAAVYVLGTVRRKGDYHGTMMSPGLCDVQAFLPRPRYVHRSILYGYTLLLWECKRPVGGRLSDAQKVYRKLCQDTHGIGYVCGDLAALMTWLVEEGYLRADQLPASRQPNDRRPLTP